MSAIMTSVTTMSGRHVRAISRAARAEVAERTSYGVELCKNAT